MRKILVLGLCAVALVGCQKRVEPLKTESGSVAPKATPIAQSANCNVYRFEQTDENGVKTTLYVSESTSSYTCGISVVR